MNTILRRTEQGTALLVLSVLILYLVFMRFRSRHEIEG